MFGSHLIPLLIWLKRQHIKPSCSAGAAFISMLSSVVTQTQILNSQLPFRTVCERKATCKLNAKRIYSSSIVNN